MQILELRFSTMLVPRSVITGTPIANASQVVVAPPYVRSNATIILYNLRCSFLFVARKNITYVIYILF